MTVRAKFKVTSVAEVADKSGFQVNLAPVTCGSEENEQFFKYTPYGQISFGTVNADAAAKFAAGAEFYVDFTPA